MVDVCANDERKVGEVGHAFERDGLDRIHGEHLSPLGLFPQREVRKEAEKRPALYGIDYSIPPHEAPNGEPSAGPIR